MADIEPRHGALCSMDGDRCRSPHCRVCGGVADAQGFCPTCPRAYAPHAPGFVLIRPDMTKINEAVRDRPRLLIICEYERDGQQYALSLGLSSRSAFEIVTRGERLFGRNHELYRTVVRRVDDVAVLPYEIDSVLSSMIASGRLREATDADVAAVIAAWRSS